MNLVICVKDFFKISNSVTTYLATSHHVPTLVLAAHGKT